MIKPDYMRAWLLAQDANMDDVQGDYLDKLSERPMAFEWRQAFQRVCDVRRIPAITSWWELNDTFCPNHTRIRYRIGMLPMTLIPEETRSSFLRLGEGVAETLGADLLAQVDDGKWFRFQVRNR